MHEPGDTGFFCFVSFTRKMLYSMIRTETEAAPPILYGSFFMSRGMDWTEGIRTLSLFLVRPI